MKPRFLICAGYIENATDDAIIYVTAKELIEACELDPRDCVIRDKELSLRDKSYKGLIVVVPMKRKSYYKRFIDQAKQRKGYE